MKLTFKLILLLLISVNVYAEDFELKSGKKFSGTIIKMQNDVMVIKLDNGLSEAYWVDELKPKVDEKGLVETAVKQSPMIPYNSVKASENNSATAEEVMNNIEERNTKIQNALVGKNVLKELSGATERYKKEKDNYPASINEMMEAKPPYLKENVCGTEVYGYRFMCENSRGNYKYSAEPVEIGESGINKFTITRGGLLSQTKIVEDSKSKEEKIVVNKKKQHKMVRGNKRSNDTLAKAQLRTLSTATEAYYLWNKEGVYPESFDQLTNPERPFIKEKICGEEIYGYAFTCEFSRKNYKYTATPIEMGVTGSSIISITKKGKIKIEKKR